MKRTVVFILVITLALSVGGLVAFATVDADVPTSAVLPDSAFVGDTFAIPTYEKDGKTAQAYIVAPDGEVFLAQTLTIAQNGVYTVEYRIDGNVVHTHKIVVVTRPSDLLSVNKLATVAGKTSYSYYPDTKVLNGVAVDVSGGAEITFNRTLDMTARTKNDTLFQLAIMPTKQFSRDFGQVIITLSDSVDPTSYVRVTLSAGNLDGGTPSYQSYVRIGANGQTAGGYEYFASKGLNFNKTDIYGTPCPFSFDGNCSNKTDYDFAFELRYDTETNAFYVPNCVQAPFGTLWLVADLDDTSVFGANVWEGFPSGKANVTVTFDRFVNKTGHVLFTQFDGIDFSSDVIEDTEAPVITVDYNGETKAPNSYVGATYKLFGATAWDFYDENCLLSAKVLYNANGGDDVWYDVSVADGKFVTDKIGKYKIIYTATDNAGNTSTKELEFVCLPEPDEIEFTDVPAAQQFDVFQTIELPSVDSISVRGGNGKLHVSRSVQAPDGSEITAIDDLLTAEQIGDYQVIFTATDFFGNSRETSVVYKAVGFSGVNFVAEPKLPEVMMAGFTYTLPTARAIYCQGNSVLDTTVKVFVDDVEQTKLDYVAPSDKSSVKVEYRAYDSGNTSYKAYAKQIDVLNADQGKKQDVYFYDKTSTVRAVQNESSVDLSFAADGSVFFANTLNNSAFFAQFYYTSAKLNFTSMSIRFEDSADANVTLTAKVSFTPSGFNLSVGNGTIASLASKDDQNGGYFALDIDFAKGVVRDINGDFVANITTDDNGNAFGGFKGGVYATFVFGGVKAASQLDVTRINNQTLGHKNTAEDPVGDKLPPELIIDGEYNTRMFLGDTLTVFTAKAFDVLGQVQSVTVSVFDAQNNVLLNNASVDEIHNVKLNKVGRYRIIYTMTDIYGNSDKGGAVLLVVDNVAPELEVKANYKQVYRVGSQIKLPTFTVSDNLENVYCDISVQLPSSEIRLLTHYANGETTSFLSKSNSTYPASFKAGDDAFVLETAGKYIVTVTAYDDNYNTVTKSFVIYAVD